MRGIARAAERRWASRFRWQGRRTAQPTEYTRLEGSTWYELSMSPEPYWAALSDLLIHAIHHRVLAHVKHLSEEARKP
jgi:hypothetical protein